MALTHPGHVCYREAQPMCARQQIVTAMGDTDRRVLIQPQQWSPRRGRGASLRPEPVGLVAQHRPAGLRALESRALEREHAAAPAHALDVLRTSRRARLLSAGPAAPVRGVGYDFSQLTV